MRLKIWAGVLAVAVCALSFAPAAVAEDKGIIALQQSVSLLLNQVADLQKSFNTQIGMIQGLVTQNTDTVNKLSSAVDGIQRSLNGNQVIASQQQNSLTKQFQALTDTIAELQAHLQRMDTTLKQIQQMQQTIPAPGTAAQPTGVNGGVGGNAAPGGPSGLNAAAVPQNGIALQLYQSALSNFQNGSPKAAGQLAAFIRTYPNDPQTPDAMYYLGTIYLQKQQYNEAIDRFSTLIEQYPDSSKTPPAELNKGIALARRGDKSAAISELRALARNYPGTEAARQADIELKGMGAAQPVRRRR